MSESRPRTRVWLRALVLFVLAVGSPTALFGGLAATASASLPIPPTVNDINPNTGPAAGGNTVVLSGINLNNARSVWFGDQQTTSITSGSLAGTINVTAPAGLSGTTVAVSAYGPTNEPPTQSRISYTYDGATRQPLTLTPDHGLPAGGNTVVITGSGVDFSTATSVQFGTQNAQIVGKTATSVSVKAVGGLPTDTARVSVTLANGHVDGIQDTLYTYDLSPDPPVVTGLSVTKAYTNAPPTITITGTGLEGATKITFGNQDIPVYNPNAHTLGFNAPAFPAGSYDITVTTPAGTSAKTPADVFTYVQTPGLPVIDSFSPTSGPSVGGTLVTVRGHNLGLVSSVGFTYAGSIEFKIISDTELQFITGSNPVPGVKEQDLFLTNPAGSGTTDLTTPGDGFTYIGDAVPGPEQTYPGGSSNGGYLQTVHAPSPIPSGEAVEVYFGDKTPANRAEIVSRTDSGAGTDVTVKVPVGPPNTRVRLVLYDAEGVQRNFAEDTFSFSVPAPRVDSISPDSGSVAGGTVVTLKGLGLAQQNGVTFDDVPVPAADITVVSDTELRVKAPAAASTGEVVVSVSSPESYSGAWTPAFYTYTAAPATTDYTLSGSATLKSLAKGVLPLSGSVTGATFDASGALSATAAFDQTLAKLTVLGFLPVTTKVALVPSAPLTGQLTGTSLSATTKVRIKLPWLSLLGVQLVGSPNCQASQLSTVPLKSTGAFTQAAGGSLAGTFSISNLTGCGTLTGIVSPLTASTGNAITLKLAAR